MVSETTTKKIGLISSISILIGAVIGIGIFFKNNSVFNNNNGNGIGVLISWILAAIIALTTALSFAEIGFGKTKGAGLVGSVEDKFGKKAARFINFNYNFFYTGLLNFSIAIFSAEALINLASPAFVTLATDTQGPYTAIKHISVVFVLAIVLLALFLLFNYFSAKWSAKYSVASTFIKFIPLILVGLAGIIFGSIHTENILFNKNPQIFKENKWTNELSFQGILSSLPAILFALDSFLTVGTIKHKMKDARRQVPLTLVIGMLVCVMFYLFITIGQIMVSQGTAGGVFDLIFKDNIAGKKAFNAIISIFIFISILGVLNSLSMAGINSLEQCIESKVFVGHWLFNKFNNKKENTKGLIISAIIYTFWFIVLLIPSVITNSDVFVDGMSNFPTLFMFAIYGTIVLKGIIDRIRKKQPDNKVKGFLFFAPISVLGCYLAFGYQFFYSFTTFPIIEAINKAITPTYKLTEINWGLFATFGYKAYYWQASIVFISCLFVFISFPFINDSIIKYYYNKKSDIVIKYLRLNNNNEIDNNYVIELKKGLLV